MQRSWSLWPANNDIPTIVHSNKDSVAMAISVFLVEQHLPEAQLVIYPDANHGAASQQRKFFLSMPGYF